ncbi:MAG: FG-GAP repeat domain-containing protein [Chitinophagaceae bacterium]
MNGDGLQDVYIGGATGQAGQIYLQNSTGSFVKKEQKIFDQYADFEDEGSLFFDCDHDGDLDLLICPGGNNFPPLSRQMQLRLYKNDGQGNFELDGNAFPNNNANMSVAIASDFDGDGDLDLFVGGRSVPQGYGLAPSSYIYVNDGKGHFTDMAKQKNADITNIGMVTSAEWADVTGDKNKELIIAGEWMAPRIFSYSGDHFIEVKTNLDDLYGWWQTISVADVDGDGKQDLVLGNIGENFYLQPDKKNPVKLWINDFNQNGNIDKILTYTVDGKDKPVFLKREVQDQIPAIKKQNLRHEDFAKKSMGDLFSPEVCKNCTVRQFNYSSSIVALNKGNGSFIIKKLPPMAQVSSINAIHPLDINQDGYIDLMLGGNQSGFPPQFGRLDASYGDVLINDRKGGFTWIDANHSGLSIKGEVRDIKEIASTTNKYVLFLRNNDYPVLYQLNKNIKGK